MPRKTACDWDRWKEAFGTLMRTLHEEAKAKGFRLDRDLRRRALEELAEALRDRCDDPEGVARRIAERLI